MTNPAAQIAGEQVAVAQGHRRQAGLGLNPRLYLQSEDLRPGDSNFSFANNTEDYAYLIQTFELDGKRMKRVALASANVHSVEAQRDLHLREIAGAVAGAYWTVVADEQIAKLLTEDVAAVDEMVRYDRERTDAGAMRGVDLIRMQIERDRLFLALQAAQRDALLARTELFRQIGTSTAKDDVLTEDLASADALPPVDLATALAQRVEILIARDAIAAAEADVRLQHANAIPDVDFSGGYKRNSGLNTGFAAALIPLAFRNRNQGEVARADVQLRIAHTQLQQAELSVRADIEAATENYQRELSIVHDTLPAMRERARQDLAIETEAYRIGGVDLLRYIDAERTEYDVEMTAIRTLAEYHQAALRLQLATGGQP